MKTTGESDPGLGAWRLIVVVQCDFARSDLALLFAVGPQFVPSDFGIAPQAAIVVISGVVRPSLGEMPSNTIFLTKPVVPERLVGAINEALTKPE
jgi:hypothetical protein